MPPRLNKLFPPHVIRVGGKPVKTVYNVRCSNCRLTKTFEANRTVPDEQLMKQFSDWGWVLGRHDREHDLCPACVAAEGSPPPEPKKLAVEDIDKIAPSKLADLVFSKPSPAAQPSRPRTVDLERERVFSKAPRPRAATSPSIPSRVPEPSRPLRLGMSTPDPEIEEAKRQVAERRIAADLATIKGAIETLSGQMAQLTALYEKVLTSGLAQVAAQSAVAAPAAVMSAGSAVAVAGSQPPKRRGRPPKVRSAEVVQFQLAPAPVQDIPVADETDEPQGPPVASAEEMPRRRGRPPKRHLMEEVSDVPVTAAPAEAPQPTEPATAPVSTAEEGIAVPRRRGRPPKRIFAGDEPAASTVPAQVEEAAPAAEVDVAVPRRRGRPPKNRVLVDEPGVPTTQDQAEGAIGQKVEQETPETSTENLELEAIPARRPRGRPQKAPVAETFPEPAPKPVETASSAPALQTPAPTVSKLAEQPAPAPQPAAFEDDHPLARRSKARARVLVDE